jgi:hypothetical protein
MANHDLSSATVCGPLMVMLVLARVSGITPTEVLLAPEIQAGIDPGVSGVFPVGVLLLAAELECRNAQAGEGERGLGCFGFGLAAQELLPTRWSWSPA